MISGSVSLIGHFIRITFRLLNTLNLQLIDEKNFGQENEKTEQFTFATFDYNVI